MVPHEAMPASKNGSKSCAGIFSKRLMFNQHQQNDRKVLVGREAAGFMQKRGIWRKSVPRETLPSLVNDSAGTMAGKSAVCFNQPQFQSADVENTPGEEILVDFIDTPDHG